jgi:hypothetical protein
MLLSLSLSAGGFGAPSVNSETGCLEQDLAGGQCRPSSSHILIEAKRAEGAGNYFGAFNFRPAL